MARRAGLEHRGDATVRSPAANGAATDAGQLGPAHRVGGWAFLDLDEVAGVLSASRTQVLALVRAGRLRAIKIRGRDLWRVERAELERLIRGSDGVNGPGP
jgi:excisionase family DNA binding protein